MALEEIIKLSAGILTTLIIPIAYILYRQFKGSLFGNVMLGIFFTSLFLMVYYHAELVAGTETVSESAEFLASISSLFAGITFYKYWKRVVV